MSQRFNKNKSRTRKKTYPTSKITRVGGGGSKTIWKPKISEKILQKGGERKGLKKARKNGVIFENFRFAPTYTIESLVTKCQI